MEPARPVGRGAAARKYDLLTALGAYALAGGKAEQRQILRLITLITARYNWVRDELAVGQREIASLWSCNERTVKREMARLRGLGWLIVRRQGARGRVTEYRLDLVRILDATRDRWQAVGPDFTMRMQLEDADTTVVPLPSRTPVSPPDLGAATEWALAQAILHSEDQSAYAAWFAQLKREGRVGRQLRLRAPSRFHASYIQTHHLEKLLAACQAVDDDLDEVVFVA